jgi:hypothetical protein
VSVNQFDEVIKLLLSLKQDEQVYTFRAKGEDVLYFMPFNSDIAKNPEWMQIVPKSDKFYFRVTIKSKSKKTAVPWGMN